MRGVKIVLLMSLFFNLGLFAEEEEGVEAGHTINFNDVPVIEFIRFVSKISNVNFMFDKDELQFNVSLMSGKGVSSESVLKALVQMLYARGLAAIEKDGYYVIFKSEEELNKSPELFERVVAESRAAAGPSTTEFFVYKLKYHQGAEIMDAMKKAATDLQGQGETPQNLLNTIHSVQWVKTTNSLLCSGDAQALEGLKKLISGLDIPLRQVFIEVLVIETDVKKSMEFGLQWAAGGKFGHVGFGGGSIPPGSGGLFGSTMQGINASNPPTGLSQIPIGNGLDMGVIGDLILHKGKAFLSLGSLVSALQLDGDSTIVLNQKIITQDNKNSKIFVGDNIPFTGSVVSTAGYNQQTTANIEYRDIGVNLSITPMLGEGDIITLDIAEEITETVPDHSAPLNPNANVNGIRTTKTNMATHVHVPDKHFLVLSGMIRNAKSHHKSGLPCLGGLPYIGAAFSKTREQDEKRNVIIFVRPHIINSFDDYKKITETQEEIYQRQSDPADFESGLKLINEQLPVKEAS